MLLKRVNFPVCLAPMVGISHIALRLVIRDYLPEAAFTIWPTEMLNSRKVPFENLYKTPETMRDLNETGLVPQILGNDEKYIRPTIERLIDWGAEGIDINMGCPVEKALKHNYGVALLGDLDYAAKVAEMTVKNSSVPVSVKLRSLDQTDSVKMLQFIKNLSEVGVSWVTLHPRTADQKRRGSADWTQIKLLKENIQIPIIGNGDVQCAEDVHRMKTETNSDLVMIGRALAAKPWIFWQLAEDWGFDTPKKFSGRMAPRSEQEEAKEYGRVLLQLLSNLVRYYEENLAIRKFRFHVRTTSVWLDFGHELYAKCTKYNSVIEIEKMLEKFFQYDLLMKKRTDLRQ